MSLRRAAVDPVPNVEWLSGDSSTRVSIPTGIVDQIAGYVFQAYKSVPRRGAEVGGILLGSVHLGPITDLFVTGFQPIPCDHRFGPSFILPDSGRAEFRAAMAGHPENEVLGYYRSHTRPGFGMEKSDREIVETAFPGRSGLVLLMKPAGTVDLVGNYFFFQQGRLQMMPVGPDFRFQGSIPGGTPPPDEEALEGQTGAAPERLREPHITPVQEPLFTSEPSLTLHEPVALQDRRENGNTRSATADSSSRKKLQWEIVGASLMILAAMALLWWQYHGTGADDGAAAAQPPPARVASLGLAVQPGEGGWRISWNANSPAARESARGALDVTEDTAHERIPLTPAQIQSGAVTYRPIGDDVVFRLDLMARDSSVASESYRVVLKAREEPGAGTGSAARNKPAPAPNAEAKGEGPYEEPEVVDRVAPEVPEGIRPRITAPQPIDVRVTINREGRVTSAKAIQHEDGLIDYLAGRAVAAAKRWTFTPAKRGGRPVESTRTIHFVFEQ